jgi:hypothetical protein
MLDAAADARRRETERTRMNTKRQVRLGLLAGALAFVALAATPGCELIVDFDRSKIPGSDASLPPIGDAAAGDGEAPDAADAGGEGPDATADAGVDASDVAPADASTDATGDATPGDAAPVDDTGAPDAPAEAAPVDDSGADAALDAADGS